MKNIIKKSLKLISRKAKSAVAVLVAMMVVFFPYRLPRLRQSLRGMNTIIV